MSMRFVRRQQQAKGGGWFSRRPTTSETELAPMVRRRNSRPEGSGIWFEGTERARASLQRRRERLAGLLREGARGSSSSSRCWGCGRTTRILCVLTLVLAVMALTTDLVGSDAKAAVGNWIHRQDLLRVGTTTPQKSASDYRTVFENVIPLPTNKDSQRHEQVAIVTKIHDRNHWQHLEQTLCLLHFAYNHKLLYDVTVFVSNPEGISPTDWEGLAQSIAPATLRVVEDHRGLDTELAALTKDQTEVLLQRCGANSVSDLTWETRCRDEGSSSGGDQHSLGVHWRKAFRALDLWTHPALEDYRYMLWMSPDAFCTKPWETDPVDYLIRNKAVILFDQFPHGSETDAKLLETIPQAFGGRNVCNVGVEMGHLTRTVVPPPSRWSGLFQNKDNDEPKDPYDEACPNPHVKKIHGFFHVTDLGFYRQRRVQDGLATLQSVYGPLYRKPDDQLAVTLPAAIWAPDRALEMRSHGMNLGVWYHERLDGSALTDPPDFPRYWAQVAAESFPDAFVCLKPPGNPKAVP